jgi:hypothetical protein
VLFWRHGITTRPIGDNNGPCIAVHALALAVATNNEREFRRFPGSTKSSAPPQAEILTDTVFTIPISEPRPSCSTVRWPPSSQS